VVSVLGEILQNHQETIYVMAMQGSKGVGTGYKKTEGTDEWSCISRVTLAEHGYMLERKLDA
jgi:hypothetical protein